jgi:hypothetical protein
VFKVPTFTPSANEETKQEVVKVKKMNDGGVHFINISSSNPTLQSSNTPNILLKRVNLNEGSSVYN